MNTKNITIFLVFVFIIILLGLYSFIKINLEEPEIIGGDKDVHGCLPAAGYSWCEASQKCIRSWEEGCEDYITQLFTLIKTESNIDFFDSSNIELTWQVESEEGLDELKLQALMISYDNVSDEDFQKIKSTIEQNGFELDKYNARGGILGEFGSYRKDGASLVCTLTGIYSDFNPENKQYEPKTTDKDVEIVCAILDKSLVPEISVEKRIREALATKYSKKVSQVEITITQETESYAKGSVKFLPNEEGIGGMFLAVKVNDEWQIIFDGNGSVDCKSLENYGFPEDMLENFCY